METRAAFNVVEQGLDGGPVLMFAHGYGCDQTMWRYVVPAFVETHRVITFDFVGSGDARVPYDPEKYATLDGYADDIVRICRDLGLADVTLVGHSVSAMLGVLAAKAAPDLFRALVMVGPSPRYIDDENYVGGFKASDIDGLLAALSTNYVSWASTMAPAIMGNPEKPELGEELQQAFCRVDPRIAENFARATFLSDNRADLAGVSVRTLVLQCTDDIIAPMEVGRYVAQSIDQAQLVILEATGHCPHLSAPDQVVDAMRGFLNRAA